MSVRVDLLGPLRLRVGGAAVDVPGARRRGLLALLALAGGRAVGVDTLVDQLWPDDPPATAPQALLSHVSRLRRHLGPGADRLRRVGRSYVLDLDDPGTDVALARRLAAEASQRLQDDPAGALPLLREAGALWRGDALTDLVEVPDLAAEAAGLAELRRRLIDEELDARLRTGDPAVGDDVARVRRQDPLRESTALLHVRALAGAGRAAEALEEAARFRRAVVEETGLEPGPRLARLQRDVAAGLLGGAPVPVTRPLEPPPGPLVGRDGELDDLRRLLAPGGTGLVTLVGPGGVGKTTLALTAASRDPARRVVVVDLAAVEGPDRVADAVVAAVGLQVVGGARTVGERLAPQDLLVVLDTCEHVLDGVRELLAGVLGRPRSVRVLATSRVPLHVGAELVVRLQPLALPRDDRDIDALARRPAVAAFLEHARRRGHPVVLDRTSAPLVGEVVRRLDGLPLAIELAAGRLGSLPLPVLRERLGRALDLLAADRPGVDPRQRTLRDTVDWSFRLLTPVQRTLLLELAVPPAGNDLRTVEAAGALLPDGTEPLAVLHDLVDASLVDVRQTGDGDGLGDGGVRWVLLDTVRSYALDRLAGTGLLAPAQERALVRARRLALETGRALRGPDEAAADRRLRAAMPDLAAAWTWARARGDLDLAVDLVLAFDEGAAWRDLTELWTWALDLAADPAVVGHPDEAAVCGAAAEGAWLAGSLADADELSRRALALPDRRRSDGARSDGARSDGVGGSAQAHSAAAAVALFGGDPVGARRHWEAAARASSVPASHLATAALAAAYAGDDAGARETSRRSEAALREHHVPGDAAWLEYVQGELAGLARRWDEAARHHSRAVTGARAVGRTFVEGVALVGLASAWAASGQTVPAAQAYAGLVQRWERTGSRTQLWTTLRNAADLLAGHGDRTVATAVLLAVDAAAEAPALDRATAARSAATRRSLQVGLDEAARAQAVRWSTSGEAALAALVREALAAVGAAAVGGSEGRSH